jgi:hypothetical protein
VEGGGQILHQSPEIHPALAGEEEEELVAVKGALAPGQLHVQAVLGDLLLADLKGGLLPLPVALQGGQIPLVGQPDHGAQGLHHLVVAHLGVGPGAGSELKALGGLDDDLISHVHLDALGVEVVFFSAGFEPDGDDLSHENGLPTGKMDGDIKGS